MPHLVPRIPMSGQNSSNIIIDMGSRIMNYKFRNFMQLKGWKEAQSRVKCAPRSEGWLSG